ncbi:MAG: hypothetical protein EAZ11_12265 [Curvibacter sp.]|nr:MAG: hypothetical protein EAZ11_12265 [Curvibacter sp.]
MKTSPVSGDLMIKLGVGAVLIVLGVVAVRKVSGAAGVAAGAVLDGINPNSGNNVIYRGANWVGSNVVTSSDGPGKNADGSWTLGGWLFDVMNPGTAKKVREITKPVSISGNQITVTASDPVSGGDMNYNYF